MVLNSMNEFFNEYLLLYLFFLIIFLVDIGVQLTNTAFEKTIVLENRGKRHQQLKWINRTNIEENQARLSRKGKNPRK